MKTIGPVRLETDIYDYAKKQANLDFKKGTEAYYEMLHIFNNKNKLERFLDKYNSREDGN